jgi:radical SAM superfamily enzyme YgiQ (UPF0313 family)
VVAGGWHPSLLPDQTLAADCIDIIVIGQGEQALLEIVQRIEGGESPKGILGAAYKENGVLTFNPRRELRPLGDMRRAGLTQVAQGADSGSPKVLHLMNKDFQKLDTLYEAADRLTRAGIRPSFNIIFAYPGEGRVERRESITLIMNVCRQNPGAEFFTNIFTPYPGAPVMEKASELGINVPQRLEDWLPWLKGKEHKRVQVMRDYIRVAFQPRRPSRMGSGE